MVNNYAASAQVGRVSRSRVTQLTSLLNLAPDIQEEILFLGVEEAEPFRISEPSLRKLTTTLLWNQQREHGKVCAGPPSDPRKPDSRELPTPVLFRATQRYSVHTMAKKIIPFALRDNSQAPQAVSIRDSGWGFRIGNQHYALDWDKWIRPRKAGPAPVIPIRSTRDPGHKSRAHAH